MDKPRPLLDRDQQTILYVYSLYAAQNGKDYLQYTAACALFYYLTTKDILNYDPEAPLLYDYAGGRKYIWEDKKFMKDINILRDHDLLTRARIKTNWSRDINAHQISIAGKNYLENRAQEDEGYKKMKARVDELLFSEARILPDLILKEHGPDLVYRNSRGTVVFRQHIDGFLKHHLKNSNMQEEHAIPDYSPLFLNDDEPA